MDNEKFQELTLKKFEKVDKKFDSVDKRLDGVDQRLDGVDKRLDCIDKKLESLDKRQSSLECDFKVMLKIMGKFSEKLDNFGEKLDNFGHNQERLERIVLRMENDSITKVRALFERSGIHENHLNDHESRIKTLEGK